MKESKKTKKPLVAICMAASLGALSIPFPAFAGLNGPPGPGTVGQIPAGYDQATWAKLNDNIMEYGELGDLVRQFNPSMVNATYSLDSSIEGMSQVANYSYRDADDLKSQIDAMKQAPQNHNPEYQAGLMQLEAAYKSMKKNADNTAQKVLLMKRADSSANRNMDQAQKGLTFAAQQLMIAYDSMVIQRDAMEKMKELSQDSLAAAQEQLKVGTATQADLLSAQKGVASAKKSLATLNANLDKIKRSLCLMTGWPADGNPDIRPVPPVDVSKIQGIQLEPDIQKAISNSKDVQAARHQKAASTTRRDLRDANADVAEQKVAIQISALYQDILQKKQDYDAANTAFEKAQLTKQAADVSYQVGSMGKLQHISAQMAFMQAQAAKQAADLDLFQAFQTYEWALEGIQS